MKNLKFIIRLMLCTAGYLFIIFILACALTSCKSTKYTKPAYCVKCKVHRADVGVQLWKN